MSRNYISTAIIRTIGRPTLINAIESACEEFENVIVVADALDLDIKNLPTDGVSYIRTGKKYDLYGSVAINFGAYAASTEYVTLLDDDDEFAIGAGAEMERKILSSPEIDIWIPTLKYNDGSIACHIPGQVVGGNVAVPTYKTELFWEYPFTKYVSVSKDASGLVDNFIDFDHVSQLVQRGKKIEWYGTVFYLVRPRLDGKNGVGQ